MLKIAIVDDSKDSISRCMEIIRSTKNISVNTIDLFESGKSFLNSINNKYNIVILDIDMPEMSGFSVAKEIRDRSLNTLIMFYTAHEQYVFKSFEFQPFRYIRKEMAENELPFALKCAAMQIHETEDKDIILKSGDTNIKVSVDSIIFFEKFKHNVEVSISSGEMIIVRKTLDELMHMIDNDNFIYAHKSAVVNLRYVQKVTPTDIILENEKKIPISRRNYQSNSPFQNISEVCYDSYILDR